MIKIGSFTLVSRVVLAPMAGVTDQPFRRLCRQFGAAFAPTEMITSNVRLWEREKCRLRRCHAGEEEPRVVQIAGSDPAMMAEAARLNAAQGAQIIDINMGCPAKKVLKRSAGSALLKYPSLVKEILASVVSSVNVPVTLKIRTGWDPDHRNGVDIARIAEDCGIRSLAVHGRTRACAFRGEAEYETIAAIKEAVSLPVFANGDIRTPQQAAGILAYTNADGIMIGRAAQGRPWIFSEINRQLGQGPVSLPKADEIHDIIRGHISDLHAFYGPEKGIFFARKHMGWYLKTLETEFGKFFSRKEPFTCIRLLRKQFNQLNSPSSQLDNIDAIFRLLKDQKSEQQEKRTYKELAA